MMNEQLLASARQLDNAATQGAAMTQLSQEADISLSDAYLIQQLLVKQRIDRGSPLTGIKLGFTSKAKRDQMGVEDLIWGRLTQDMEVLAGSEIQLSDYVHPRAEPEIAFLLAKDISAPLSLAQAYQAVEAVAPAIEIIDSRYKDFRFSLADVVADNASSTGYVLGRWVDCPAQLDNLGMALYLDGNPVEVGSSAAIMGDPILSLVAASRLACEAGLTLKAGSLVLAGAATAAIALKPNSHVEVRIQGMASVGFQVGSV